MPRIECSFVYVQQSSSEFMPLLLPFYAPAFIYFSLFLPLCRLPSGHWSCSVTIWLIKFMWYSNWAGEFFLSHSNSQQIRLSNIYFPESHTRAQSPRRSDQLIICVEFQSGATESMMIFLHFRIDYEIDEQLAAELLVCRTKTKFSVQFTTPMEHTQSTKGTHSALTTDKKWLIEMPRDGEDVERKNL